MILDWWHENYLSILPQELLEMTLIYADPKVREELLNSPFRLLVRKVELYLQANAFTPPFLERTYLAYAVAYTQNEEAFKSSSPAGLPEYSDNEISIVEHMIRRASLNADIEILKSKAKFHLTYRLSDRNTLFFLHAMIVNAMTLGHITRLDERNRELKRSQTANMLSYVRCLQKRKRLLSVIQKLVVSSIERTFPALKNSLEKPEHQKLFVLNLLRANTKPLPFYPIEEEPYVSIKYLQSELLQKLKRRIQPEKVTAPLMLVDLTPRHWVILYTRTPREMFIFTIFKGAVLFYSLTQERPPLILIAGARLNLDVYKYVRSICL